MDQKIGSEIIKKHNLLISHDTGVAEVEEIFSASNAKSKCKTEHGTIVLAEVVHGRILSGKPVSLTSEGRGLINDVVVRIEMDHQEVSSANATQYVGLCLQKTRLKTIKKALAKLN